MMPGISMIPIEVLANPGNQGSIIYHSPNKMPPKTPISAQRRKIMAA